MSTNTDTSFPFIVIAACQEHTEINKHLSYLANFDVMRSRSQVRKHGKLVSQLPDRVSHMDSCGRDFSLNMT